MRETTCRVKEREREKVRLAEKVKGRGSTGRVNGGKRESTTGGVSEREAEKE